MRGFLASGVTAILFLEISFSLLLKFECELLDVFTCFLGYLDFIDSSSH